MLDLSISLDNRACKRDKGYFMAVPVSFYEITLADNSVRQNGSPETTSSVVPISTLGAANIAATATLCGNLSVALAAITLGTFAKNAITYERNLLSPLPAPSVLAQRENKWLARYHDATTYQKFQVSFGTADLSLLTPNTEFLSLASTVGLAFKTAFEAVVVSPADAAHAVVLDSMQFVGRNA